MKSEAEILKINRQQKQFYNSEQDSKPNFVTKIWADFRNGILNNFRTKFNLKDKVYQQHKLWLDDLCSKKVLDLGCLRGNALSIYMAQNAKQYVGIDLSDKAISILNEKLVGKNCKNAFAIAVDFLSPDFKEANFDVIYAYGVLHHFENFEVLCNKINQKLNQNGIIIAYDPLETNCIIKLIRTLYRPFQSDKDWEWPFNKTTLNKIENNFKVLQIRGVLGRSKYGILLNLLPIKKKFKERVISKMIEKDWECETFDDVLSCMHLTMLIQKK